MPVDSAHRLRLQPIGEDAWRLCDGSVDECDAAVVLAYIERRDGRFEVTWVRAGAGTRRFESMDEVLDAAAAHLQSMVSRSRKPRPIAARPPLEPI